MPETKRQTEFDVLRLLAILAVIAMHAGGNAYLSSNFDPRQHSMFVAAIVWCVPVFFLISGRFFLDPQRYGINIYAASLWCLLLGQVYMLYIT
ncbi:MAG: acyltransferase family protein [Oscillospiraceae bacterium]